MFAWAPNVQFSLVRIQGASSGFHFVALITLPDESRCLRNLNAILKSLRGRRATSNLTLMLPRVALSSGTPVTFGRDLVAARKAIRRCGGKQPCTQAQQLIVALLAFFLSIAIVDVFQSDAFDVLEADNVNLQPIGIIRQANVLAVAEADQVEAWPRHDHEALLGVHTGMLQELDEARHGFPPPLYRNGNSATQRGQQRGRSAGTLSGRYRRLDTWCVPAPIQRPGVSIDQSSAMRPSIDIRPARSNSCTFEPSLTTAEHGDPSFFQARQSWPSRTLQEPVSSSVSSRPRRTTALPSALSLIR